MECWQACTTFFKLLLIVTNTNNLCNSCSWAKRYCLIWTLQEESSMFSACFLSPSPPCPLGPQSETGWLSGSCVRHAMCVCRAACVDTTLFFKEPAPKTWQGRSNAECQRWLPIRISHLEASQLPLLWIRQERRDLSYKWTYNAIGRTPGGFCLDCDSESFGNLQIPEKALGSTIKAEYSKRWH